MSDAPHSANSVQPARPSLLGMTRDELIALCRDVGVKEVHGERLNAFIYRQNVSDPMHMPEIPERLRQHLLTEFSPLEPACVQLQADADGTRKMLLRMGDGKEVESVLIPAPGRLTQCISSQVGCAVGCQFCLTATAGLTRNLTATEMLAEVMTARAMSAEPIRNIVLMGMGEPLHNYEHVSRFVRIATDPLGMAFSPRRVTLSTAGLIPGIERMVADDLPCNLAVSLNATTDAVRNQIMPINQKYPLAELIACMHRYIKARNRKRILVEYVMLADINDSLEDAHRLVALLDGMGCTVNLLPFNPFPGSPFKRPNDATVDAFRAILVEASMVAVVRESRGREISAACGQLKTEVALRRKLAAAHR